MTLLLPTNITSLSANYLILSLLGHDLSQVNSVVNYQNKLLDLMFCNCPNEIFVSHCVSLSRVDNFHIQFEVSFDFIMPFEVKSSNPLFIVNFRLADFVSLNNFYYFFNWNTLLFRRDTNSAIDIFYEILLSGFK